MARFNRLKNGFGRPWDGVGSATSNLPVSSLMVIVPFSTPSITASTAVTMRAACASLSSTSLCRCRKLLACSTTSARAFGQLGLTPRLFFFSGKCGFFFGQALPVLLYRMSGGVESLLLLPQRHLQLGELRFFRFKPGVIDRGSALLLLQAPPSRNGLWGYCRVCRVCRIF